eukprot:jgi/Galph1/5912/GphlegSOOS_G4601.1
MKEVFTFIPFYSKLAIPRDSSKRLVDISAKRVCTTPAVICCHQPISRKRFIYLLSSSLLCLQHGIPSLALSQVNNSRAFMDVSVGQEYIGRLVFRLYDKDAPHTVATFLAFLNGLKQSTQSSKMESEEHELYPEEPLISYQYSLFYRCTPGLLLEGGKIPNLRLVTVGDETFYDVGGSLMAAYPQTETNNLRHTERGLLTRKKLEFGPEFGITLGPCPELDSSFTVFGKLEDGFSILETIEHIPVIGDRRNHESSQLSTRIFDWQRDFFLKIGREIFHDRRADEVYPNKLLRRVSVIQTGTLN